MKRLVLLLFLSLCFSGVVCAQRRPAARVKYGSNASAGNTFVHDGVRLYYEVYGTGEPLLVCPRRLAIKVRHLSSVERSR